MRILGLNAYHGDASAAQLTNGILEAAIEEERLNRQKHWAGLPVKAALAVMNHLEPDHICISRSPKAHFIRKVMHISLRPSEWARLSSRASNSIRISHFVDELKRAGIRSRNARIHYVEHHRAHLASAFFCSPFDQAAVMSIDGFGDFSSIMWGDGRGNKLDVAGSALFPHSLGLFYTAFTQYLGFPKYGDEYKMMGLSAYGEPRFVKEVREIIRTEDDQVRLNLDYFTHHSEGIQMTWDNCEPVIGPVYSKKMVEVFGAPRTYRSEIQQHHADLAASVQKVLEENYFSLLNFIQKQTRQTAICLAGGVALNCVANGLIFEHTDFRDVYIQPAAH